MSEYYMYTVEKVSSGYAVFYYGRQVSRTFLTKIGATFKMKLMERGADYE